jgi:lipopolysaccharide transport system permease protein
MSASISENDQVIVDRSDAAIRQLPPVPVIRIRPSRFWENIDFAELWHHREVLYFLIWRDLKVRYKQTIIGAAWVIVQPILITVVFAVFLGRLIKVPSDGIPYPVFAYAALLLWTFISNSILSSSYSLVINSQIITRVYFPRIMIPAAAIGVRLVDLMIASAVLIAMIIYYRVPLGWQVLMFPIFIIHLGVLAVAIGILAAALNVKYRDVGTMLPILLQAWMFASPIVYASSLVPARMRNWYALNPLMGIVEGSRAALFNLPFDWTSVAISAAVTLGLLLLAVHLFAQMENGFADNV